MPINFLMGANDFNTPLALVQEYQDVLEAPYKELVVFEVSDHLPLLAETQKFSQQLIRIAGERYLEVSRSHACASPLRSASCRPCRPTIVVWPSEHPVPGIREVRCGSPHDSSGIPPTDNKVWVGHLSTARADCDSASLTKGDTIRGDYAVGREGGQLYLTLGHAF